jgi:hypothetical protein
MLNLPSALRTEFDTCLRNAAIPKPAHAAYTKWLRYYEEPLAWAVRKSDVPLQFALTQRVKEWKLSGRLQQIMSQWITLRIATR